MHEGSCEVKATLHSAGVGADPAVHGVSDIDKLEDFGHPPLSFSSVESVEPSLQLEQFPSGRLIVKGGCLEGHTHLAPDCVGFLDDIVTGHGGVPCCGNKERAQDADQSRLPGAIWPQEPIDHSSLDRQVEAGEGPGRAEATLESFDLDRRGPGSDGALHLGNVRAGC